jgi:hypothetical protein
MKAVRNRLGCLPAEGLAKAGSHRPTPVRSLGGVDTRFVLRSFSATL